MRNVKLQHVDFRWVWSKVLPQVYDDSLSYYEQLCKLGAALDTLATQCEEHFTEIYALIEIINDEIARLKERMDDAEANIADLMERTGVLREDVDRLLQLAPDITVLEDKVEHLEGGNVGEVLAKHSSTDFDFQWKIVRGVPAYGSSNEGQLLSVIYDGDTYELDWIDPPTDIPEFYASDDGKVLKIELDGNGDPVMYWGLGLPELDAQGGDANKILGVNGNGDGIEWKVQEGTIPGYAYTDRNKALCVNSSATGVEWAYRQDELPPYTDEDANYVLSVNSLGTGIYWQNNKVLGVEAFEGNGLPTSDIKCKTGDLYRDTTTNKLYWCVRYIDPDNITDLSYLGLVWNERVGLYPGLAFNQTIEFNLSFESGGSTFEMLGITTNHVQQDQRTNLGYKYANSHTYMYAYQGGYGNDPWRMGTQYKTITNFQGTDCTNADLINYITDNATITGAGSTWIEVSPSIEVTEYTSPLKAPSFRPTGDYVLTGSGVSGQRNTVALTGATPGTWIDIYVRNTQTNYVKKYGYAYNGTSTGYVFDYNNPNPPTAEDWFIESTPSGDGKLTINCGTSSTYYSIVAVYTCKP